MKKLLSIIFLLLAFSANSQTGVIRLEFEAAINSDIYKVIPLANQGFMVFYETTEKAGEESKYWLFAMYGPSFEEIWKVNIPVITDAVYEDYCMGDSLVYLFFLNPGRVKTGTNNFQLLSIDLNKKLSFETKGSVPSESSYVKFRVAGQKVFLALDTKDDQGSVFSINLSSSELNEFSITYPDQNFIEDIVYDPVQDQVLCIISNFLSKRQNKMFLLALSADAGYKADMEIQPVIAGKYLNTARITLLDSAQIMLTGTYGSLAAKIPSQNEYFGIESTGIFTTRITSGRQDFMNYYNFTEFRNLRAGASARDYYRLAKKKDRESPEYSMNYELVVHQPERRDTTIVTMMEAFYPEFRTVSDISYDYWGRPVTHTYSVFDGFKFFNAILAGVNLDGELVWDNSLEVNLPPTNTLTQKSSYFFDGEPALLFYNDGTKVSYRICLENSELEPFTALNLETSHNGDRITAVGANTMIHWYGYNFLAYGYETIQNNLLADKNERTVFYINKISLE
jgi:hypothetical protein